MDLMHLPLITYFIDWHRVTGTYLFGFLGLLVCGAACYMSWHQITHDCDVQY